GADVGAHPEALQRRALAQRLGLPAAGGLLPRQSGSAARGPASETASGPTPPQRSQPGTGAAYAPPGRWRGLYLRIRLICATADETNHDQNFNSVQKVNRDRGECVNYSSKASVQG